MVNGNPVKLRGACRHDVHPTLGRVATGKFEQFGIATQDLGYKEMPALFDEWAHVACYNNETIIEDPNIRDFWGESLDKLWSSVFDADGGLGGGIWGMIDETFMLPENLSGFRESWGIDESSVASYKGTTVGYGEWGIVDVWRRKKPEFWNTKKAYSPIRILDTTIKKPSEKEVFIPIYNRFDHTNINEVTIKYAYNGTMKALKGFDLKPHEKGLLKLPIAEWNSTKDITIDFFDANDKLIDTYTLKAESTPEISNIEEGSISGEVSIEDKKKVLIVRTQTGDFYFDKKTGLLQLLKKGNQEFTISGPFMTYKTLEKKIAWELFEIIDYAKDWTLVKFSHQLKENLAIITIKGNYGNIKTIYELQIQENGSIKTTYDYNDLPKEYVRELGI